jgi:carboxyl-terminal processing protease
LLLYDTEFIIVQHQSRIGNRMKLNRTIPTIALAILIALSFIAGFAYSSLISPNSGDLPKEFDSLIEVWTLLKHNYVNQSALDPEKLAQGAIDGMLNALGDPYTAYYYDYEEFYAYLEGSFEGIGAYVSKDDGPLTIISPIAGSPAEQAGIKAGDIILEIDGESTDDLTVTEAVLKIRGPKGTTVTLLIQHEDESDPVEMQIVRDEITEPSVDYESLPDNIGYIQITQFASSTVSDFQTALTDMIGNGSKGLILDLRGNPGGFLDVVADIADEFLDSGIILYVANDNLEIFEEYTAESGGIATDMALAVLVDGGSASASEVLAGALQDHGRAAIIGTQTFGKGSVNQPRELRDGSALYLTTARWLTPDKHLIEGIGITPDYEVEFSEEDWDNGIDNQLDYAVEYLKSLMQ